jgi:hypothetical protein
MLKILRQDKRKNDGGKMTIEVDDKRVDAAS